MWQVAVQFKRGIPALVLGGVLLLLLGVWIGRPDAHPSHAEDSGENLAGKAKVYTCSMHPQIRQPEPGDCPLCGMDLIPASESHGEELGARMMSMSESAMRLAEVETVPVVRRFVDLEIPLVGKVDYDETRIRTIAARVPGRMERLFVDYTGVPVFKGNHLAEIYSPELFASQEELLQSIRSVKSLEGSASASVRRSTEKTVAAAREKLRLLGLSPEQVTEVETRGTASATVSINSPLGGIVINKTAKEGEYVETGTPLYTVADLSMVWVNLDAYESDIAWLRYGQEVDIRTEAYGDRIFAGWISFINPVLNPETRTITIRVVVDNADGMLRPNMFARALAKVRIAADDQVITRNLSGKWICPMHPEIIGDEVRACDLCGMDLEKASDLGYADQKELEPPLVVPASAVLTTGKRSLVYRRVPGSMQPTFEGVEVQIGPRAGSWYTIRSGLQEGQDVVVQGNFKIDSALQLLAKPSMMNPEGGATGPGHHHHTSSTPEKKEAAPAAGSADVPSAEAKRLNAGAMFLNELTPLYADYLKAQTALAADQEEPARTALHSLANRLVAMNLPETSRGFGLKEQEEKEWMEISPLLLTALKKNLESPGLAGLRKAFKETSILVIRLEKTFGHAGAAPHQIAFCPMADENRGAEWLQSGETVSNPYFGAAMLRCGEILTTLPGTEPGEDSHGAH